MTEVYTPRRRGRTARRKPRQHRRNQLSRSPARHPEVRPASQSLARGVDELAQLGAEMAATSLTIPQTKPTQQSTTDTQLRGFPIDQEFQDKLLQFQSNQVPHQIDIQGNTTIPMMVEVLCLAGMRGRQIIQLLSQIETATMKSFSVLKQRHPESILGKLNGVRRSQKRTRNNISNAMSFDLRFDMDYDRELSETDKMSFMKQMEEELANIFRSEGVHIRQKDVQVKSVKKGSVLLAVGIVLCVGMAIAIGVGVYRKMKSKPIQTLPAPRALDPNADEMEQPLEPLLGIEQQRGIEIQTDGCSEYTADIYGVRDDLKLQEPVYTERYRIYDREAVAGVESDVDSTASMPRFQYVETNSEVEFQIIPPEEDQPWRTRLIQTYDCQSCKSEIPVGINSWSIAHGETICHNFCEVCSIQMMTVKRCVCGKPYGGRFRSETPIQTPKRLTIHQGPEPDDLEDDEEPSWDFILLDDD